MAKQEINYSQLPQEVKSLTYRIDIRSRYIKSIARETSDNSYIITLKQRHRISDEEFELNAEQLRYLYRKDIFKAIRNPDRREGLILVFQQ